MLSWYVLEGSTPTGPHEFPQLAAMAGTGRLSPDTRVARAGATTWSRAGDDADLAPLFAGQAGTAPLRTYSFSAASELGWRTFRSQWGWLVIANLLFGSIVGMMSAPIYLVVFVLIGMTNRPGGPGGPGSQDTVILAIITACCCFGVLMFVLVTPLQAGFNYMGAAAARGKMEITDLFIGFKRWGAVMGTAILGALISGGIFLVCLIPFAIGGAITAQIHEPWPAVAGGAVSLVLAVLDMLFLSVFMSIPLTLVADPRVRARGGIPALSLAWQLGRRVSPSYFALMLVYGLLGMVGSVLTCGIGAMLFANPLILAMQGAAYDLLTAPLIAKGDDPRRLP